MPTARGPIESDAKQNISIRESEYSFENEVS